MNKFVIAAVVAVMSTAAIAEGTNQNNTLGTNNNYEGGYSNTVTSNENHVAGETVVTHETTVESYKPNGYVASSNLTNSGGDTCLGSQTGGISAPGFGISTGSTTVDTNCEMIKNARLLVQIGLKDAATLLLMNSRDDVAEAIWGAYPELAEALTSTSK